MFSIKSIVIYLKYYNRRGMKIKGLAYFIAFLIATTNVALCQNKLAFVIHMSNLGATFPKESNEDWVKHPGSLTPVGMRQLYLLGRQFRQKYIEDNNLLDDQYNQQQFTIRSFYSDRTAADASAYYFGAGFYMVGSGYSLRKVQIEKAVPPVNFTDYKKYQEELRDAALLHYASCIPVMTNTEIPNYPLEAARLCTNLNKISERYLAGNSKLSDLHESYESKYSGLFGKLSKICKFSVNSLSSAFNCRDYVVSSIFYARTLEEPLSNEELSQLDNIYYLNRYLEFYGDQTVAQVVSHGVLKEIDEFVNVTLNDIKKGVEKNKRRAMISYMVNDDNILGILRLMKYSLNATFTVPFASSLQIEAYQTGPNVLDFELKILFNDNIVHWNEVNETVPVADFIKWIKDNTLHDFHKKCTTSEEDMAGYIVFSLVGMGVIILILIVTCYFLYTKKPGSETESPQEVKVNS